MPIDYNTSSFDDMCAQMQAMLDDTAKRIEKLTGTSLADAQTKAEKQMTQAPKFEADRLAYILGRPASDRSLEDTRYLAAFPDERRAYIMEHGSGHAVDQQFLASTIITELKSIDEASRAEPVAGEQEELAKGIGEWRRGSEVKAGEFDVDAIKPGMDDASRRGAAAAILRALGK